MFGFTTKVARDECKFWIAKLQKQSHDKGILTPKLILRMCEMSKSGCKVHPKNQKTASPKRFLMETHSNPSIKQAYGSAEGAGEED